MNGFDKAPAFKDLPVQTEVRRAHDRGGEGGLLVSASDVGANLYFAVCVTSRKLLIFPETQVFHR